ncbi:MAG: DUF2892 domain-containing protein [Nitrospinae bacterium]|nr:DUF2892 domain-containing protein [Nitrospinota bacterium]
MTKNVGGIDKIVRIVAGIAIVGAGVIFQSWWGAFGLIPLATGLLGWCPPYTMLGMNTCKTKKEE